MRQTGGSSHVGKIFGSFYGPDAKEIGFNIYFDETTGHNDYSILCRMVIGWSMQSRITKEIVLNALLMAVCRRNPKRTVTVHSNQGSQYTSHDWQHFLKVNGLEGSMSRRGNCHDNAVAESFFQLLKRERIKRRIYPTREDAKTDVFDYIEMFYNKKRKHGSNNMLSPIEFEKQYEERLRSV